MKRLLKIEWLKIIHYRTAWIFILMYCLILVIMGLSIPEFRPKVKNVEIDFITYGAFNFPVVWQNITYFAAIGKIFLAVIIVTNITNEYSNGTLKQNLIDGLNKKEFLASKVMGLTVLSLLSTALVFVVTLILGTQYGTVDVPIFSGAGYIGTYFLKLLFFFSFLMFLSFLFRKSAFALLMVAVWWVVESLLTFLEYYVRVKLLVHNFDETESLASYLPLKSAAALIPFPTINTGNLMQGLPIFDQQPIALAPILTTLFYVALFVFLSYTLLKRRDL